MLPIDFLVCFLLSKFNNLNELNPPPLSLARTKYKVFQTKIWLWVPLHCCWLKVTFYTSWQICWFENISLNMLNFVQTKINIMQFVTSKNFPRVILSAVDLLNCDHLWLYEYWTICETPLICWFSKFVKIFISKNFKWSLFLPLIFWIVNIFDSIDKWLCAKRC